MKATEFKPLAGKILVQRSTANEKTAGGIHIPDAAKEKPKRGVVKSVGPGTMLEDGTRANVQVKAGDQVYFLGYAGTEIKMNDQEYLVMDEKDVLGIVCE